MSQQAFLDHFERTRLGIEGELLRLPESSRFLARFGQDGQAWLHATPTVMALVRMLCHAPRSASALADRLAAVGPAPALAPQPVGRVLTCFGIAYYYRFAAKRVGDLEFAQELTRIACLATLGPEALEQVDWVVQAIARSRRGGSQDWLAPALLLIVWLTGMESTSRARRAAPFLEQLQEFVDQALREALDHRIHMGFPW